MTDPAPVLDFETCPARTVVGTARDYTMDTRHAIPAQWQAFFSAQYDIPGALTGAMFGVSFMADGQGAFRYGVGVEVDGPADDLPDDLCAITLSEGDYAVLRHFGPVSDLPGQFDRVFSEMLPAAGRVPRDGAVFERYPDDPRNGPDAMSYEIWVPVAPV